jgi:intracellular multiplication protein IcmE
MPRLSNSATNSGKDPFDLVTNKPEVAKAPDAPVAPPVRPAGPAPAPVQAAQPVQKSTDLKDAEKNMAAAMVGFLNSWGPSPQRIELNYVNVVPQGVSAGGSGSGNSVGVQSGAGQATVGGVGAQADASNGGTSTKKVALKAGSILHAVVITSVNSDEAGPVLAQIVAGPYAGGRLIGKFELGKDAEKMTLTFSTLTMQNADKSYAITSFAIDPDTARTALASDVDNHYLSRYGMFAAASFLKGYSKALSTQGTTQTVNAGAAGVSTTTSYPQMNTHDIAITALGEVGSEIAGSLKDGLKRPPTVTLNSGTEIGVLVMTDTTF